VEVLLKPYSSVDWEKKEFNKLIEVIGVPEGKDALTEKEIIEKIDNVDILLADVDIKVTREILRHAKKLRAVICTSIGVDYVDIDAATEHGIIVTNNPDFCVIAVAEYAIGLIFTLLRHIPIAICVVKEGNWELRNRLEGTELQGKTIGVVGLGRIGREVAKKACALGMKVMAYDPYVDSSSADSVGAKLVLFEELLRNSDIITIHIPLLPDTHNLFGEKEFKLIKKKSYIVNVSRGGIVDEKALARALTSGRVAGAALDVLTIEPPQEENPLLKIDNVFITPHIGWNTREARLKSQSTLIEQVNDVLKGKVPKYVINKKVLSSWKERFKIINPE